MLILGECLSLTFIFRNQFKTNGKKELTQVTGMNKISTFSHNYFLCALILAVSCSSKEEQTNRMGRCKYNCSDKWEEAKEACKKERNIKKELCLKHTFWKLNDWM